MIVPLEDIWVVDSREFCAITLYDNGFICITRINDTNIEVKYFILYFLCNIDSSISINF